LFCKLWKNIEEAKHNSGSFIQPDDVNSPDASEEEDDFLDDSLLSSTTEDDHGGFLNSGGDQMHLLINETFPVSVIKFFKLFFSDVKFSEDYHIERGDSGISLSHIQTCKLIFVYRNNCKRVDYSSTIWKCTGSAMYVEYFGSLLTF
jgi:hypothetical protein